MRPDSTLPTCSGTPLVTVAPLVVHHPALAVQAGGAPGLAGVAVPGGAGVEGLPGVEKGEDAGPAIGPDCLASSWETCHHLSVLSQYIRQVLRHWRPSPHLPEMPPAPPQVWSSALAHSRQQPHSSSE